MKKLFLFLLLVGCAPEHGGGTCFEINDILYRVDKVERMHYLVTVKIKNENAINNFPIEKFMLNDADPVSSERCDGF